MQKPSNHDIEEQAPFAAKLILSSTPLITCTNNSLYIINRGAVTGWGNLQGGCTRRR